MGVVMARREIDLQPSKSPVYRQSNWNWTVFSLLFSRVPGLKSFPNEPLSPWLFLLWPHSWTSNCLLNSLNSSPLRAILIAPGAKTLFSEWMVRSIWVGCCFSSTGHLRYTTGAKSGGITNFESVEEDCFIMFNQLKVGCGTLCGSNFVQ